MNGGGGGDAPSNGGAFLLQLLKQPPHSHCSPTQPPPPQIVSDDPAVAAVGRPIPAFPPPHGLFPATAHDSPYVPWSSTAPPPPFAPHNYFSQNPNFSPPVGGFNFPSNIQPNQEKLGFMRDNVRPNFPHQQEKNIVFGSLNRPESNGMLNGNFSNQGFGQRSSFGNSELNGSRVEGRNVVEISRNPRKNSNMYGGFERDRGVNGNNNRGKKGYSDSYKVMAPPPGFTSKVKNVVDREKKMRIFEHNVDKGKGHVGNFENGSVGLNRRDDRESGNFGRGNVGLNRRDDRERRFASENRRSFDDVVDVRRSNKHLDSPGFSSGTSLHSVSASDIEGSTLELHGEDGPDGERSGKDDVNGDNSEDHNELDDLEEQLVDSLGLEDGLDEKKGKKKHHRDKDYRSDKRGQWMMGQRMRIEKRRSTICRRDINRLSPSFLEVFESLIPADEEKAKQKQLLALLGKLVSDEWPQARLYLYGSCANSFGFPKSDIDVCLELEDAYVDKAEVLLKLADILQSDNFQNVQALTRARVPIVKLMDPVTGISGDICVNNVLAVVNTKLLRDYAKIDVRLRQLAFIVKHWAKSRGVNETYQGTLSSYAYVLMCIHFLQQRRPAILPCLQAMEVTYCVTVDNVECAFFDQVERLRDFGSRNGESIAQLVWAFFHYWAYCHDYANDVISVRTGDTLSKRDKDWTRRVGNDRHLICIEDPFELSHDLGRVVDKFSIRVLREEFERAAEIMQSHPNPCVKLFEPYIPQ